MTLLTNSPPTPVRTTTLQNVRWANAAITGGDTLRANQEDFWNLSAIGCASLRVGGTDGVHAGNVYEEDQRLDRRR
jgi:hypothetical protein